MLLLGERRRQRLFLRLNEQSSNRRIRRAGQELDRLLTRLGLSSRHGEGDGDTQVLARLIEVPQQTPKIGRAHV